MAAHAFDKAASRKAPQNDFASVICARDNGAARCARNGSHVTDVACEEAHGITARDIPHADCAIAATGGGEDVRAVRVPAEGFDVGVVADEEAQWRDLR